MRLILALGAAVVATTMVADAHTGGRHFAFHRGGEHQNADANGDGWVTRDEASAHADRMFDHLDRDDNGRLEDADHEALRREIEAEVDRSMQRVRIELEGIDEEIERHVTHLDDENCTRTTENVDGGRRVTVVCENSDDERERRSERRVHRRGDHVAPVPPIPPLPPVPPLPMMAMWGDDEESDLNGDGWLSREEFRAQQLRHFDARDGNRDGRVRDEPPPAPPAAPTPPTPPSPPARPGRG